MEDPSHKSKIDALKDTLYDRDPIETTAARRVIHAEDYDVKTEWDHTDEKAHEEDTGSFFMKFFWGALLLFVAASLFVGFRFFSGSNTVSGNAIDLSISIPQTIEGGQQFPVDITIGNNNPSSIQFVELSLEYPQGESTEDEESKVREKKDVPAIAPNTLTKEQFEAVLFGVEGSERTITVRLEYSIEGSTAIFEKTATAKIVLTSAPVTLTVKGLEEVSANQEVSFSIDASSLRGQTIPSLAVRVDYPTGFQFLDASIKPSLSNNVWLIGALSSGQTKKITVRGIVRGEDADERTIRARLGTVNTEDPSRLLVVLNEARLAYTIKKPFLSVSTRVNGTVGEEHAISLGAENKIQLEWKNTLDRSIQNAEFSVKLSGALVDEASVIPTLGYYDSSLDTIFFTRSTDPTLAVIAPGRTGKLEFEFKTKQPQTLSMQPIQIIVGVKARRVSEENVPEELAASQTVTLRPESTTNALLVTSFSSGPLENEGSIPPRAESETTYTLVFTVSNTTNPLRDAGIRFKLPLYVRYTDISSVSKGAVSYDPISREVYWGIGDIDPASSGGSATVRAYIKVGVTPSLSSVGRVLTIIPSFVYSAKDTVTGSTIQQTKNTPATTRLTGDANPAQGHDVVGNPQ